MGFASENINALVIDFISMPTLVFASTSGTSGCRNWDFANATEQERYVVFNWELLSQEAAKGSGESLEALSALAQCHQNVYPRFQQIMQKNYQQLFTKPLHSPEDAQIFLNQIQHFIKFDPKLAQTCW